MDIKYYIIPVIEGRGTGIPLHPEPASMADCLKQIENKSAVMQHQGYWLNEHRERIPLKHVGYHIVSEADFNDHD